MERTLKKSSLFNQEAILDWFIALVCVLSGLVGLRLVNDADLWGQMVLNNRNTVPVGSVSKKKGLVRYRPSESPFWHDVAEEEQQSVAPGDTVFTGDDGSGELRMNGGDIFRLFPNSLLVIEMPKRKAEKETWLSTNFKPLFHLSSGAKSTVDLRSGTVQVELKKGSEAVEFGALDKKYNVSAEESGGNIEISVDGKKGSESVKFGALGSKSHIKIHEEYAFAKGESSTVYEAEKMPPPRSIEISSGEAAVINNKSELTIQLATFHTLFPKPGEEIVVTQDHPGIALQWEVQGQLAKNQSAHIEIQGAETKVIALFGDATSKSVLLKEGQYQWRVTSKSEAPWSSFSVVTLSVPEVLGPSSDAAFLARKGSKIEIPFSWQPVASRFKVELEVRDSNDSQKRRTYIGRPSGLSDQGFEIGEYSWRLRTLDEENRTSGWSSDFHFQILEDTSVVEVAQPVAAPVVTAAPSTVPSISPNVVPSVVPREVPAEPVKAKEILTHPKAVETADPSKIEVLPTVETTAKPTKSKSIVKVEKLNDSVQIEGNKTAPVVETHEMEVKSAKANTRLEVSKNLKQISVLLSWKSVPGVEKYIVSLFNSAGEKVREEEVTNPKMVLSVDSLTHTKYDYRVSAKLQSGKIVESPKLPIEIVLSPPLPKLPKVNSILQSGRPVLMTWERTSLTEQYRLQISKDVDFSQKILNETRSQNYFDTFEPTRTGKYFWRVKSLSHGKESDWSTSGSFTIK